MPDPPPTPDYEVTIIGGAPAGASLALLLLQWRPETRVLIVERGEQFGRKVGESTAEVTGLFLTRVLGIRDELTRHHLPKQGLRYWVADQVKGGDGAPARSALSEIGPDEALSHPTFHLDRARLDGYLLDRAVAAGAALARPATVRAVDLTGSPKTVTYRDGEGERTATSRWVIDASGRTGRLARQLGVRETVGDHPTAAAWGRWRNVGDFDSLASPAPGQASRTSLTPGNLTTVNISPRASSLTPRARSVEAPGFVNSKASSPTPQASPLQRGLCTNHFGGYGWWCWLIPLATGETSIGVVYDTRLFDLPAGPRREARYQAFLRRQPGLGELLREAEPVEDDFLAYQNLTYRATRYMGPGWGLVGDAAAFLDPLYSPGLDHMAYTVYATAQLLHDDLAGRLSQKQLTKRIVAHNARFTRFYDRWLGGVYRDKYALFGEADLTAASYCIDVGAYYLGLVQSVERDPANLASPSLGRRSPVAKGAYYLLKTAKARLVRLARRRRRRGMAGGELVPGRYHTGPLALGAPARRVLGRGLGLWLKAELVALRRR